MKKHRQTYQGYGTSLPPDIAHVIIYFVQKGKTEHDAKSFFSTYSLRKWKNRKGNLIKDWKMHAWEWIWSRGGSIEKAAEN